MSARAQCIKLGWLPAQGSDTPGLLGAVYGCDAGHGGKPDSGMLLAAASALGPLPATFISPLPTTAHAQPQQPPHVCLQVCEDLLLSLDSSAFTRTLSSVETCLSASGGQISPLDAVAMDLLRHEHCERADSAALFTTGVRGITTSSEVEFWFVIDPLGTALSRLAERREYEPLRLHACMFASDTRRPIYGHTRPTRPFAFRFFVRSAAKVVY